MGIQAVGTIITDPSCHHMLHLGQRLRRITCHHKLSGTHTVTKYDASRERLSAVSNTGRCSGTSAQRNPTSYPASESSGLANAILSYKHCGMCESEAKGERP